MAYQKTIVQVAQTGVTDLNLTLYFSGTQPRLAGLINGTSERYDVALLDVMSGPDAVTLRNLLRAAHLAAMTTAGYIDS